MSAVLKSSNRGGIPCLKSTSAVVVDTTLTITFPIYSNFPKNYSGVAVINVAQPFTTSGIANVNLVIQGTTVELMLPNTAPVTGTNIGQGKYQIFIDHSDNSIQLL